MENKIIQSAAMQIAYKLNQYANKEGIEFTKMTIGVEILLINISKLVIIYALAMLLGTLWHTLVVHGAYLLLKRYSFGLHALNSTVCTVVSCMLFVVLPWLLQGVSLGNLVVLLLFPLILLSLWLYAPADTAGRPLVGKNTRVKMKRNALVCGVILMVITLLVPIGYVKFLLILGAAYQAVSILPFTYKILKRSGKNYEQYEKLKARS